MLKWFFPDYDTRMTLALAGIWQSTTLASQLAASGECDRDAFSRCLRALLNTSPQDDSDLFGEKSELNTGLAALQEFCTQNHTQNHASRYALQVTQLQKKFLYSPKAQMGVHKGLEHSSRQAAMYGHEDDNLIHSLGRLYQDHLSPLMPIQILGKHQFLQQDLIAARVRSLLFSGVRFSHLWRQSGGNTLHLVIARNKIRTQINEILN